jgi:hypothetical protein
VSARDQVLGRTPHAGYLVKPGAQLDEAVVEAALDEVASHGILDRDDARIAAYAHHAGLGKAVPISLYRQAGLTPILRRELATHYPRTYLDYDRVADTLQSTSQMQIVRWLGDVKVGWSLAVLSLAYEVDASAVFGVTPIAEDGALLLPMLALIFFVPRKERKTLLTRLVSHDDLFVRACGIAFAMQQLRESVLRGISPRPTLRGLRSAKKTAALAALGAVLDDFGRWVEYARFDDESRSRVGVVSEGLQIVGECLARTEHDVEEVLEAAGRREVQVLACITHWRVPDENKAAIGKQIKTRADRIFDEQFASRLNRPDSYAVRDALHPEWMTLPLTIALGASGLTPERFVRAYNGLAADAFSKMTRYATWLTDRRRAVSLIAIAGCVAKNRSDGALLDAVRAAATHALSQPSIFTLVYPEGEVSRALGFPAPDA